jgi:hypothetical protein
MLLVFAIASRTICTPTASATSDASPAEQHALAVRLFRQPKTAVESQLGLSYEGMGLRKKRWQCYQKGVLDIHILYDSQGKSQSVLVCQLQPEKSLLTAWPPLKQRTPKKPRAVQWARR